MPITAQYPPDVFMLVPKSQLSKRHFDRHPIWSEYYDYEEREAIISWGVDRIGLEAQLERTHNGNEHCAYPILRPYPLPARQRIYIRARFVTAGGTTLDGYVMNENAFVVTLFARDGEHTFSRHAGLGELNNLSLRELQTALGRADDPVFPLAYETEFLDSNGALIAGVFEAPTAASGRSDRLWTAAHEVSVGSRRRPRGALTVRGLMALGSVVI